MEQEFALMYGMPGITDLGIWSRTQRERKWLLQKLVEVKQAEAEKIEAARQSRKT